MAVVALSRIEYHQPIPTVRKTDDAEVGDRTSSDRAMMQRPAFAETTAANDNAMRSPMRPQAFRAVARSLPIAGLAGVLLVALSGALLVGLFAVGLLAAAFAALEPARRRLRRSAKRQFDTLGHQVVG